MQKRRLIIRILVSLAGMLAVVLTTYLVLLAFPQVLIPRSVRAGVVHLYYDDSPSAQINRLAVDVDWRLRGSDFYDSLQVYRVFFVRKQGLYTLYCRLAMVTPLAQGFALSLFGNSFVSETRLNALGRQTGGCPKYGIWEGDPAHTIAHEIGHLYLTNRIGRSRWENLPHWKQEGLPEYIANIAVMREDTLATLKGRVRVLRDDWLWGAGSRWDRTHYEAGLLVEFLLDVQGYSLEQVICANVTKDETLAALIEWCENIASGE